MKMNVVCFPGKQGELMTVYPGYGRKKFNAYAYYDPETKTAFTVNKMFLFTYFHEYVHFLIDRLPNKVINLDYLDLLFDLLIIPFDVVTYKHEQGYERGLVSRFKLVWRHYREDK